MGSEELQERLLNFSVSILKFLKEWQSGRETDVIRYQLSKSATSAGANYEEAQASVSRKEFGVKVAISLKEMRETRYWLRIINALDSENAIIKGLIAESEELTKILGKINSKINTKSAL